MTSEAIIAQVVHMDARLDTLSDELCQVNTHVGRIEWRQAIMGGFTVSLSPSPRASKDESDDNGFGGDNVDEDDVVALLVTRRWLLLSDLPFVICDKKGE